MVNPSPTPLVETFPVALDQYTLLERLATGGMADVYLAIERHHAGGLRWIAVKRVRGDLVDHPEFLEYFATEGRVSLACRHPHLPTAYHLGRSGRRPYLALEYIPGPTVLSAQRAASRRRRPIAVPAVVAIAMAAARALEHLHGLTDVSGQPLRVIHRDVTPQNLLIGPGGVVKLIDFGVARAAVQTHRTQVGVIKGKYAYIAPEQLDRERVVDQRADLFSLGTVIHELLTLEPLFHGPSDLATTERVRTAPIPDPSRINPDVPPAIAEVILTALARDPDRRWPSASALVEALERAVEQAGLWPWPSRLAREVAALCGPPRLPALTGDTVTWSASLPPPSPDDGDDAVTPVIEVRSDGGGWELEPRVAADPQLSYFLQAGAVDKPWQGGDSTDVSEG